MQEAESNCKAKEHIACLHAHTKSLTNTFQCTDEHNQECACFHKFPDVADKPACKAMLAPCLYGLNAVDANKSYRSNLEVLHVTVQQLAF
eukprot:1156915-Pelagomonas_calceolata.AAC.7